VISVAFSPDGKRIVSGANDRTVRVTDAAPPVLVLAGHLSQVTGVAVNPAGTSIVSAGGVWDGKHSRYADG